MQVERSVRSTEIPITKKQVTNKSQIQNSNNQIFDYLVIEIWKLFGICILYLGISAAAQRLWSIVYCFCSITTRRTNCHYLIEKEHIKTAELLAVFCLCIERL